ncbi:glycosyltransferase family 4 protein [Microcystis wesenbergii]|uniref:Glycosyltransferase family 4 protein n=1 Tax=Microcystis wesenbergii NRERC-220 TaxID=3068991 RepID=A0ABU3HQY9_9CHRO|nr:glycosyltransferase family 4 protein [Microcystis wesenbergii]MDT3675753.1 glycosyltransferase family 4 protein [Microcystis wesenbergii NRERC-220]
MKNKQLKILILYDCIYPKSLGGVEHRNYCVAKALAEKGHKITLAGWCEKTNFPFPNVRVIPLPFQTSLYNQSGKRNVLTSIKFALATLSLRLKDYDIIETASIPYIHLFPLAIRCLLARKPLVITWIEYWGDYWRDYVGKWQAPLFKTIEWISAQLGDKAHAISQLTAERVQENQLQKRKIPVIPCGVYLEQIELASRGTQPDAPPLVYAGRLMKEKQVDLLLEAISFLDLSPEQVILTIIGDGPDRSRLESLALELGIQNQVKFLGRLPTIEDVWREVSKAKIAVQPSSREGFGLFPLESMALGLPVVYCQSSESAVSFLVRDQIEGLSAKAESVSLANAIENLLTDNELTKKMSENALARARLYDWSNIAEQLENLFYLTINKQSNQQ